MSASRETRLTRTAMAGIVAALSCVSANALGIPDGLDDPLLTRPPVLDHGAVLPNDPQPIVCQPQVDLTQSLTLTEAIDVGLCNNPQIKAAWAAIKIQAAAVGEARAAYLPNASVAISKLHTRTQYPGSANANTYADGHSVNAGVSWRLFDFGTRSANRDAANWALDAALANHDAALQKVMSGVVGAYFDAQTVAAALTARQESTALALQTYEATLRRQRRGAAAQSDVLQAVTALAKARLAEQRAKADERSARAALLYALGIAPSTTLKLAELKPAVDQQTVQELAQWLNDAAAQHPAIVAARAQWEAAQAKVEAARAEGLPTVDATGNFYQNGYPNQGLQPLRSNVTTVGITLTIPLFEGFARTYKVRGAQAQAEQSEAQRQDTEHQVLTDVIKAHATAVSAAGSLQASNDLLRAAQASLASSQRRYEKGAADILELLTVQSALADAQQERVRSVADWESARLRLVAAAGLLGRLAPESQRVVAH